MITFEASNELSDDVRYRANGKFIVDDTFVQNSKLRAFIYEYKGRVIRGRKKEINLEKEVDALRASA